MYLQSVPVLPAGRRAELLDVAAPYIKSIKCAIYFPTVGNQEQGGAKRVRIIIGGIGRPWGERGCASIAYPLLRYADPKFV